VSSLGIRGGKCAVVKKSAFEGTLLAGGISTYSAYWIVKPALYVLYGETDDIS
jgi:hypothetical protein